MKYLILSDIHSNLEALQSVLQRAYSLKVDALIILGDLVGYGASPNEVTNIVRKLDPHKIIRGNHDRVSAGLDTGYNFNPIALHAAIWTQENLSLENIQYISGLMKGPLSVDSQFDIVHGSPWDEDYYILSYVDASKAFNLTDKDICFFGHTHVPIVWSLNGDRIELVTIDEYDDGIHQFFLDDRKRYMINPGSVGQPRDGNPKASFALYEPENKKVTFFRVDYDIKTAQLKIIEAGLHKFLAERLSYGA